VKPLRLLLVLLLAALGLAGYAVAGHRAVARATAVQASLSGYMKDTETITWAPAANATGYALFRDSTQVSTAGPGATSTRFAVSAGVHTLSVRPLFSSSTTTAPTTTIVPTPGSYDEAVLLNLPDAYWAMNTPASGHEADLTGDGFLGSYVGGVPPLVTMPNGDKAVDLNGTSQYMTVPSSPIFSIPTTHEFTWEAWVRPDTLQHPKSSTGYADWMGKCANYSPTCEWEARFYNEVNPDGRCSRISAYVFNPGAGLGSAADWQPNCGLIQPGKWLYIVGE